MKGILKNKYLGVVIALLISIAFIIWFAYMLFYVSEIQIAFFVALFSPFGVIVVYNVFLSNTKVVSNFYNQTFYLGLLFLSVLAINPDFDNSYYTTPLIIYIIIFIGVSAGMPLIERRVLRNLLAFPSIFIGAVFICYVLLISNI